MILGCIDIGSNTTRLLVADAAAGALTEIHTRREFTRLGATKGAGGNIRSEKIADAARVIREQVGVAREAGAESVVAVATAAIRNAPNRDELVRAVEEELDGPVRVLSGEEEARLCFAGATQTLPERATGTIAVVDVGGGSTELAVGTVDEGVAWFASVGVGSGMLADAHLRSDPPSASELEALREHVTEAFRAVKPPAAKSAVAVGGTATSLSRFLGGELAPETMERGVRTLSSAPVAELASRFELHPERVRLLPAGILLLEAASSCLALPLRIARGGLREGVLLEMAAQA